MGKRGEIATKLKPVEVRDTQVELIRRETKTEIPSVYYKMKQNHYVKKKKNQSKLSKQIKMKRKYMKESKEGEYEKLVEKVKQDPTQDYLKTTLTKGPKIKILSC